MTTAVDLKGQRILITGATGFVAEPIVKALAKDSTVYAAARFKKPEDKAKIESLGAQAVTFDLMSEDLSALPDVDYVINLAVAKLGDWDKDLAINAEGVGRLMLRYQSVKGFVHFSSTAVYEYDGHVVKTESSPLGDNHRDLFETYSISKIAAETVVRFLSKQFNIPASIARLNVPYGSFPCWPYFHLMMAQGGMEVDIHPEGPNTYSPIHSDDYVAKLPYLLAAANTPAETFNLGGDEEVSIEQWCEYLQELTGVEIKFNHTEKALGALAVDSSKLSNLSGPCSVHWKDGLKRMLEDLMPDAIKS